MEVFATDMDKLGFLFEADADPALAGLDAEAAQRVLAEEAEGKERPKYVATYVGSKQKLVDWIWRSTPEGVKSVLDAFSGSAARVLARAGPNGWVDKWMAETPIHSCTHPIIRSSNHPPIQSSIHPVPSAGRGRGHPRDTEVPKIGGQTPSPRAG
jgi:hypothetical protein